MSTDTSDTCYDTILECLDGISEDQALSVVIEIERRFEMFVAAWTKSDVDDAWRRCTDADANEAMPQPIWEHVRNSYMWRKGLADVTSEAISEAVVDEIFEALNAMESA